MHYAVLGVLAVLVIVGVSFLAPKLRVATPLLLVLVGIGGSFLPGIPAIDVPPEWILAVVLPPILYASAVNVPLLDFRRNIKAITGLSVLLVVGSALVTGWLLFLLLPDLSIAAAVALGAVVSPTDAVAATAIGRRLGIPPRLVTVLEGEGLVNDASALVLLRSAIAATAGAVSLGEILGDFAYAVTAAIVVGVVVGWVTVWVRARLHNAVLNTTISFAVPFLAYIPAEELRASGVLAVVVAGLLTGHQSARYFSATDRISERINWRTVQFVLENGVFLLIGLELRSLIAQVQADDLGVLPAIALGLFATVVLVLVRIVFVVPLIAAVRRDQRRAEEGGQGPGPEQPRTWSDPGGPAGARRRNRLALMITRRRADREFLRTEGLGWRGGAVLAWSGMRGVVTLAAAQSLPREIPYRPQLVLIAVTVAIVTLMVQGGTLPLLIRGIGIVGRDEQADHAELVGLVAEVGRIGRLLLDSPELAQADGSPFDADIIARVRADSLDNAAAIEEADGRLVPGPHAQRRALRRMVLEAERAALLDARATGAFSSRVIERAQEILDLEESRLGRFDVR